MMIQKIFTLALPVIVALTATKAVANPPGLEMTQVASCTSVPEQVGDSAAISQYGAVITSVTREFGSYYTIQIVDLKKANTVLWLHATRVEDGVLKSIDDAAQMNHPDFSDSFVLKGNKGVWKRFRSFGPTSELQFLCK